MTIKVQDDRKGNSNYVNHNILECVKFWNREGKDVYSKNISGALGSKETNELARSTTYDDFVLEMLMIDCRTFCNSTNSTHQKLNLSLVELGVMFGFMRTMKEN